MPILIFGTAARYVPLATPRERARLPRKLPVPSHIPLAVCARSAALRTCDKEVVT